MTGIQLCDPDADRDRDIDYYVAHLVSYGLKKLPELAPVPTLSPQYLDYITHIHCPPFLGSQEDLHDKLSIVAVSPKGTAFELALVGQKVECHFRVRQGGLHSIESLVKRYEGEYVGDFSAL